jgi:hypothetical protein
MAAAVLPLTRSGLTAFGAEKRFLEPVNGIKAGPGAPIKAAAAVQ